MIAQPTTSKFIIAVAVYAFTWNWAGHCRNHSEITATILWTHTSQAAACSWKKSISNHEPVTVLSMLPVHFLIVNVNGNHQPLVEILREHSVKTVRACARQSIGTFRLYTATMFVDRACLCDSKPHIVYRCLHHCNIVIEKHYMRPKCAERLSFIMVCYRCNMLPISIFFLSFELKCIVLHYWWHLLHRSYGGSYRQPPFQPNETWDKYENYR